MDLDVSRLKQLAINESGFVFDPVTGHTFTLNDTGLAVLQRLKEGSSPEVVVDELGEMFELDGSEDVARDVDDFLSRLREHGLLK
ncbi:MAG: HPr-rel-A system PqqD family peptide chaperone [Deltaproteobacteria bacterium]|jgi:PqqD family protein of HPr-rel-A system|nr:HPr-rel-A system PqqD family peptide chaperone [Deltaproteobacteria bacterium]MBW2533568.1 HPr-rel-A system PqqD family peptide chaperone [Deltaproteobacteria bacterium]